MFHEAHLMFLNVQARHKIKEKDIQMRSKLLNG